MTSLERIQQAMRESMQVKEATLADQTLLATLEQLVNQLSQAFKEGRKALFCGNGGSAADAQHIAAELSGRFYYDRPPLFAEALHVNGSFVTAVANDYSYDAVYSRAVEAMGRKGDFLFGISTSGNSNNVLAAMEKGRSLGMKTVAMTGGSGGKMRDVADFLLNVPSETTPRIQETHILLGHILCELVEAELFPRTQ